MYYPEIGNKIKGLRVEKFGNEHGSQKRFAEFLGINYVTYRGYEDGNVTLEALKLISKKTGATFSIEGGVDIRAAEEETPYEAIPLLSPEEKEYLEKLLSVLRNPNTKKAIQENIDTFLKVPRPEPGTALKKKKE